MDIIKPLLPKVTRKCCGMCRHFRSDSDIYKTGRCFKLKGRSHHWTIIAERCDGFSKRLLWRYRKWRIAKG